MNLTQTGKHLKDVSVSELRNQHLPVGGAVAATTAQTKIDAQVGLLLPLVLTLHLVAHHFKHSTWNFRNASGASTAKI